jgi:16S rRNA A1518/A1519 N6-dimethyltransferase RsmA/KsgA/DIM1 with predicted DNA glycosylase/AP lyase activity
MEQACSDITAIRIVDKSSFDPAPKIDSIVLRFTLLKDRDRRDEKALMNLWKAAFSHPRKTLLSNIK